MVFNQILLLISPQMKLKLTLKDIARELGFSTSTVSKALKDSHEISENTRDKIKAFAKQHNYKPNTLALSLRQQKTYVLGVIIPEIVHHFFSTIISGIEHVANEKGYNLIICVSNESFKKEVLNIEMLTNGRVDGLLISISKESLEKHDFTHLNELIDDDIPLVLFDRINEQINCDKVIIDDIGGAFKATEFLINLNRRKIALITTPDYVTVGELRTEGYIKALKQHNIPINKDLIIHINEKQNIKNQISPLFNQKELPDAIFTVNEIYAAITLKIAKEKGINIPKDISVIGFTDGLISEYSSPSLTTMSQHGFTMGQQAAELLIDRIENKTKSYFETKVISADIKVRESTKIV